MKAFISGGPFPLRTLLVALVFTTLLLSALGWHLWNSYNALQDAQQRNLRLQELTGVIAQLDEVLTMSARMAAATGDLSWEDRYLDFEPKLDAAIKEAERLAPDVYGSDAASQTDVANIKLVNMEHRSFDLVRAGDRDAAALLLFSSEYDAQKEIYSDGNQRLAQSLKANGEAALATAQRGLVIATLAVGVPLLCSIWLPALVVMNRNMKARRRAEEALERALEAERELARRDPLTGVLNHGAIVEQMQALVHGRAGRQPFALVMADVDGLKTINDTYGHLTGDAVLIAVADALSIDGAIVGRYGGDEFLTLLVGATRAGAERYRDAALARLQDVSLAGKTGEPPVVSASFGFAWFPKDASSVTELIGLSDSAMYASRGARPAARVQHGPRAA